jgi:hypothetical protein
MGSVIADKNTRIAELEAANAEHDTLRLEGLARIAELEAEVAALKAKYMPGMTDLMVPPETLDAWLDANPLPEARIAELEAKRDQALKIDRLALAQVKETTAVLEQIAAERDRLKAALLPLAEIGGDELFLGRADYRVPVSMVLLRACRAALSGERGPAL